MWIKLPSGRKSRATLPILLFAKRPSHPSAPLGDHAATARSAGQGRPQGRHFGALPWTGASTMAGFVVIGRKARLAISILLLAMIFDAPQGSDAMDHASTSATQGTRISDFITEAAQRFGIPTLWIAAVMHAESAGDPHAISPKGAIGLMQIMPQTYSELRAAYGFGRNPYNPHDNILAGAAYLREMHDRYGSPGFLAAYNAGPARYEDHLATGRPLPDETRSYVRTLAPRLGLRWVDDGPHVTAATFDPSPWNQGPLFVVREIIAQLVPESRVARDDHRSSEMEITRSVNARSTVDVTALVPQRHDLFVRRIASETRP